MQTYLGEVTFAKLEGDTEYEKALQAQSERQQAWMQRTLAGNNTRVNWKLPPRYRKKAYQISCHMHNVLKVHLKRGLLSYKVPTEVADRKPARDWPRFSWCPDFGSENFAAYNFWKSDKVMLNVDLCPDLAHNIHDDIFNGLKAAGQYNHAVMALIRLNIPVSPWHQDTRYRQCMASKEELFATQNPETCALFQDFSYEMLHEPAGRQFLGSWGEGTPEHKLWHHLMFDGGCMKNRGTKCIHGRFLDLVRKLKKECQHPGQRFFLHPHMFRIGYD